MIKNYFNAIVEAYKEADRNQALYDWHNDMAGRETGRMTRTVFNNASGADAIRRERRHDDVFDLILNSVANYAARRAALMDGFKETGRKAEELGDRIDRLIEKAEVRHEELMDRAASLPNGTKVFKNTKGEVVTLDGEIVDVVKAQSVIWKGNEPSHEAALRSLEDIEKLHGYKREVMDIQHEAAERLNRVEETKDGGMSGKEMHGHEEWNSKADQRLDEITKEASSIDQNWTPSALPKASIAVSADLQL